MRLNLGCGYDRRDGYLNIDFLERHEPDLVADVLHLPLADACADEILAQDVLEHLPRTSTLEALTEWRRVSKDGAAVRIRVPSVLHAADLMRRVGTLEMHRLLLQNLYGTQAYTGDVHLTSFTDLTLTHDLHDAGWARCEGRLVDGWLWDVTAYAGGPPSAGVYWESGLYELEGDPSGQWRWAGRHGTLALVNPLETALSVRFSALVDAGHAPRGRLEVSVDGRSVQKVRDRRTVVAAVVIAPGARTEITVDADFAAVVAPGDPRDLRCRLVAPEITVRPV